MQLKRAGISFWRTSDESTNMENEAGLRHSPRLPAHDAHFGAVLLIDANDLLESAF